MSRERNVHEKEVSPCYKCTERWVTEHDRCHGSCEKYAIWSSKQKADKKAMKDAIDPKCSRYFKTKLGDTARASKHRYR